MQSDVNLVLLVNLMYTLSQLKEARHRENGILFVIEPHGDLCKMAVMKILRTRFMHVVGVSLGYPGVRGR